MSWTLIVAEKAKASAQIAKALDLNSKNTIGKHFVFFNKKTRMLVTNLSGHIAKRTYKDRFKDWSKINFEELITAAAETVYQLPYITLFKEIHTLYEITKIVCFTDNDEEGELIAEDFTLLFKNIIDDKEMPTLTRWRASALDSKSIKAASLDEGILDYSLAESARQRHLLDLKWGSVLTVLFTIASRTHRYAKVGLLSVGRVQTVVLCLIAKKELEILNFKPEQYMTRHITTNLGVAESSRLPVTDAICKIIDQSVPFTVTNKKVIIKAPTPINSTDLMKLGQSVKLDADTTMKVAESLYLKGLITYPRTDSRHLEPALLKKLILSLMETYPIALEKNDLTKDQVYSLLDELSINNKERDKTHPSIVITGEFANAVSPMEQKLFDRIVKQLFSILKGDTHLKRATLTFVHEDIEYRLNHDEVIRTGFSNIISATTEEFKELPKTLLLKELTVKKHVTTAPKRYTSASIIKKMEDLGIGTKATRHTFVSLLQKRAFLKALKPSRKGLAFANFIINNYQLLTSAQLTKQIEQKLKTNTIQISQYQQLLRKIVKETFADPNKIRSLKLINSIK